MLTLVRNPERNGKINESVKFQIEGNKGGTMLIKDPSAWVNRKHMELDFYFIQFLSSHEYLKMIHLD